MCGSSQLGRQPRDRLGDGSQASMREREAEAQGGVARTTSTGSSGRSDECPGPDGDWQRTGNASTEARSTGACEPTKDVQIAKRKRIAGTLEGRRDVHGLGSDESAEIGPGGDKKDVGTLA